MSVKFDELKFKKTEQKTITYKLKDDCTVENSCNGWFGGLIDLHSTNLKGIIAIRNFLDKIIQDEVNRVKTNK